MELWLSRGSSDMRKLTGLGPLKERFRKLLPRVSGNSPGSETRNPFDENRTSRFIRKSEEYSSSRNQVKWRAFRPHPIDRKTSVFCIDQLSDPLIWNLADSNLTRVDGGKIVARADIGVNEIRTKGFTYEIAEPPPRHANIAGWPSPEEKDLEMSRAQELAAVSVLRLRKDMDSV